MENTDQFSTQVEKDQWWLKMIEEWRQSEQSAAEWVKGRKDITYGQFMKNKSRLSPKAGLTEEFLGEETTWSSISMEIPTSSFDVFINDCRIVVKSGFDQELFLELVEVLKR